MDNLVNYIQNNGSTSFDVLPFNEVDAAVFSQIVYLPLETAFQGRPLSLSEAAHVLSSIKADKPYEWLLRRRLKALEQAAAASRYEEAMLVNFCDEINKEEEKQFSAATFDFASWSLIAFRGTDLTLAGWKEDLNMALPLPVPAQKDAVRWLERTVNAYAKPVILAGHSKGGNLALYAATFCRRATSRCIRKVYSFDGPGLNEKDRQAPGLLSIAPKVCSLLPQNSFVGILMYQFEPYEVVHSVAYGLFEHDMFSWEVEGAAFRRHKKLSVGSRLAERSIEDWMSGLSTKDRELFIETLYTVLTAAGEDTIGDLVKGGRKSAHAMLRATVDLPKEVRKRIRRMLRALVANGWDNTISLGLYMIERSKKTQESRIKSSRGKKNE